jgi:hypothetical protein
VDETGTHTSMTRDYARSPIGERVVGIVPRNRGVILILKKIGARDLQSLAIALKHSKDLPTRSDLPGWFSHCGYEPEAQCA